jgi:hypothetical protein
MEEKGLEIVIPYQICTSEEIAKYLNNYNKNDIHKLKFTICHENKVDITCITECMNIKDLDMCLMGDELTIDISPIVECKNIRDLRIGFQGYDQIIDISSIAMCENIKNLHMGFCQDIDISPIAECRNIEYLYLNMNYNTIKNIHLLSELQSIKQLSIISCKDINYDFLSELHGLESVDLSCSDFSDLNLLTNSKDSLKSLDIEECKQITNIVPIAELENLVCLQMDNTLGIYDYSPISACINLGGLWMGRRDNAIININFLANLEKLDTLGLPRFVSDISPIYECKNLNCLFLCDNVFVDPEKLAECKNLTNLDLNIEQKLDDHKYEHKDMEDSKTYHLDNIGSLQKLRCLSRCKASSEALDAFDQLPSLETIGIKHATNCDLLQLSNYENIKTLYLCESNNINDLTPLSRCTSLKHIYLYLVHVSDENIDLLKNMNSNINVHCR